MHRPYQPILPTANLYLQDKWDRNRYETHRKKVAMAVPAVNTKGSQTPTHLLVNMKQIQMDKEKTALIEQQNLIHSNKLTAIRQSHGRPDNWNFYPQRSLNAAQLRQNLNKISYENEKILERILRRDSEYGRWESEWEKVKRIQTNISRYPPVTWAEQHRVSFIDCKRNTAIHNLMEGSEIDGTQIGSTLKLQRIQTKADHHGKNGHFNHANNRNGFTPMHGEKLAETDSRDKFCKRGMVINATLEKPNYKDQPFSKPKNCTKRFSEVTSGGREQDVTKRKDSSQAECMSENSQPGNACGTKLKSAKNRHMSYEGSDQTFHTSQEESDASSCYLFQGSEKSCNSCSSQFSGMSKTLSSLSINLKTRMTNSSTSLRNVEIPVGSSHKLKISNTHNVYGEHEPSSQESSKSRASIRHTDTSETSFHGLEVLNRQNL